jgi:hypothetical protein
MAAPGDETAAGAGGYDRLRASHADREQAIEVLKAAFVQERLDRDELDARVGQALASQTHAELAVLTMDIPVGLMADLQRHKPARWPVGKVVAGAGLVVPPGAMLAAAFLSGNEQLFKLCMLVVSWFIIAWVIAGTRALANWYDKRAGRRSTPGLSPGAGSETSDRESASSADARERRNSRQCSRASASTVQA